MADPLVADPLVADPLVADPLVAGPLVAGPLVAGPSAEVGGSPPVDQWMADPSVVVWGG